MPQGPSGRTYPIALRDLAFQLCPSFSGILLGALVACDSFSKSLAELLPTRHSLLNHCRKIKNPASSAGRNHPHWSGSTRCSTSFYPVLVKNPTIGSTSRLLFISSWKTIFDPTVMPLSSPRLFRAFGPSAMIPAFLTSSSPLNNLFFLNPVHLVQIHPIQPWRYNTRLITIVRARRRKSP
jgi:hypothetical protein